METSIIEMRTKSGRSRAYIVGTNISVVSLVLHMQANEHSVEDEAKDRGISENAVRAAIQYWNANKLDVDRLDRDERVGFDADYLQRGA